MDTQTKYYLTLAVIFIAAVVGTVLSLNIFILVFAVIAMRWVESPYFEGAAEDEEEEEDEEETNP